MAKRIKKDGKFYRMRRGKLVEIPSEWVGETVHPQTIRNRPSKKPHKFRNLHRINKHFGKAYKNGQAKEEGSEPNRSQHLADS